MRIAYSVIITLFLSSPIFSSIDDYFQYSIEPSPSNYGETGILELPNARIMKEGAMRFTFSSSFPNEYTALTVSPFNWFEATYRYTEIKNNLYGPSAFSGNQTAKDKSFDAKVRIIEEGKYFPDIAIGLRDFAGTGAFSSEYLVATKSIGNAHITSGLGWGILGSAGGVKDPLSLISERFEDRSSSIGQGGDFNVGSWFAGEASLFAGIEYDLKRYGLRLSLEYDTSEPDRREYPVKVDNRFNAGLNYYFSNNLNIGIALERGNQFRVTFSLKGNFAEDTLSKPSAQNVVRIDKGQSERIKADKGIFYRSLNKSLQDEKIYIQAASLEEDSVSLAVGSANYRSLPRLAGRSARIASALSPDEVEQIEIRVMNGPLEVGIVNLNKREFDQALSYEGSENEIFNKSSLYTKSNTPLVSNADFMPEIKFPEFSWTMSPALKHQIGGPEAFYLGQLWWRTDTILKFSRNFSLYTSFGIDLYNNFDELNNPSASSIPHVRSDIQEYLKEGKNNLQRMKFEYVYSPFNNWFLRADLGMIEEMFGGVGGEILYRPFDKNWAVGFSAHRVRQREYKQRFGFRDYETDTGFLELYYDFPKRVSASLLLGKYLAGDKGATLDLQRRFKSGFTLGVFATLTDLSKEEFGEGSFDKGFYFGIPTELFYTDYRSGTISFGLHPLTKDGGAIMNQHNSLFSIIGDSNYYSFEDKWLDILD